jgi:aspartate/tyrosine/aromatic aminotransferase
MCRASSDDSRSAQAARPALLAQTAVEFEVDVAPPDPILVTAQLFNQDTDPKKVNLGIGAYRTDEGVPWVLPSVKEAEMLIAKDATAIKEYLPIDGLPQLRKLARELVFTPATIESGRVASVQALSGTGALRVAGEFLKEKLGVAKLYHSAPTWGNHTAIFKNSNMEVSTYPYYDAETRGFDFDGMMSAIPKMEPGSVILLHACAHNPTGVDPTEEQWVKIVEAIKAQKLLPLIDNAYQGYASGNLEKDNFATKLFDDSGMEFVLTQSFAKNFGLYGERVGMLHFVCTDRSRAEAVLSQLKLVVRPMYSSPPKQGAVLVTKVLEDPQLKAQWSSELKQMSERITKMRFLLRKKLEELGTPGTWNHITDQIGMFSYTGLTAPQCERLINEFHIYLLKSGRISMAGINESNVDYVAEKIALVVREN